MLQFVNYGSIMKSQTRKERGSYMKRKLNELWKVKEGSKTLWKVQAPKGILTFNRKQDAEAWVQAICK